MPIQLARKLVGKERTAQANRTIGLLLAAVAGAINAGGFLAVQQYTSHVTGIVSAVADNLALGQMALVVDGVVGVLAFLLGAMTCAVLVNLARRKRLGSLALTRAACCCIKQRQAMGEIEAMQAHARILTRFVLMV